MQHPDHGHGGFHLRHAAQDGVDPQQKLFGFEGLGEVIIRPGLEPFDAVGGFAQSGQQQDRGGQGFAKLVGEGDPVHPRHHHVQHQKIEFQSAQKPARLIGVAGDGDQKAVAEQEFLQQAPDAFVVVDNQQMWRQIGHGPPSFSPRKARRWSGFIIASNT